MVGPIFGERPIEIGGARYRFVLGYYGLGIAEQTLGKPWPRIFADATNDGWGISVALALFHAGLAFHHETITRRQASLLLEEFGMDKFAQLIADAFRDAMPETSANPLQPATATTNGTGVASSQTG